VLIAIEGVDGAGKRTLSEGLRTAYETAGKSVATLAFPRYGQSVVADIAAEAVEPVATAWDNAARLGLSDRRLYEAANRCVAVAAEKAPAELSDAMERLVRSVEKGRSPGDDFADQVIDQGIAATVAQLAQGGL